MAKLNIGQDVANKFYYLAAKMLRYGSLINIKPIKPSVWQYRVHKEVVGKKGKVKVVIFLLKP